MFHKQFTLVLFVSTMVSMTAFPSPARAEEVKGGKIHVLCSIFPIYQFTRNVAEGSSGVEIGLLLSPGLGCPHDYSLTPQDIQRISHGDVLVINGLGLDEFIGAPLKRANPNVKIIDSSKGIVGLSAAKDEDEEEDEDDAVDDEIEDDEAEVVEDLTE